MVFRFALRSSEPLRSQWSGAVRACRCGAIFVNHASQPSRHYQTKRKSQATQARLKREKGHVLEAGERSDAKNPDEQADALAWRIISLAEKQHFVRATPEAAFKFYLGFHVLWTSFRGRVAIEVEDFNALKTKHGVSDEDCMSLVKVLLQFPRVEKFKLVAKALILAVSRAGYAEATLMLMNNALLQNQKKPGTLMSPELVYARAHLKELATGDTGNYRAMVLEGKIANASRDQDRAIALWTKAMDAAVAASELEKQSTKGSEPIGIDDLQLSSPWIELTLIHWERSVRQGKQEMDKCKRAMEIGCQQDDPYSYYHAASFFRKIDTDGNHVATSDWLYNITKAAASQHAPAAYELGKFYVESGWKYIEDEPPDDLKPTPFDSYPSPVANGTGSTIEHVAQFLGLRSPKRHPEADVFQSAMFPHNAQERVRLGLIWLRQAAAMTYAPAWLFEAKVALQKTLWGNATAPQNALRLKPSRYTYASKHDWQEGASIVGRNNSPQDPVDPKNPWYDRARAKHYLQGVFYMYQAHKEMNRLKGDYDLLRRQGRIRSISDVDDLISEDVLTDLPPKVRVWARFPQIRESYEAEVESLYDEAKAICDEEGWDMYDDDGLRMYQCKSSLQRELAPSAA